MRPASAEETAFADLSADMQFSMSILGECPQRDEAIAESSWAGRMIAGQGRSNAHSEIYIYERTGVYEKKSRSDRTWGSHPHRKYSGRVLE